MAFNLPLIFTWLFISLRGVKNTPMSDCTCDVVLLWARTCSGIEYITLIDAAVLIGHRRRCLYFMHFSEGVFQRPTLYECLLEMSRYKDTVCSSEKNVKDHRNVSPTWETCGWNAPVISLAYSTPQHMHNSSVSFCFPPKAVGSTIYTACRHRVVKSNIDIRGRCYSGDSFCPHGV